MKLPSSKPTLITPGYLFNTDPVCHVIDGRLYVFCSQELYSVQNPGPEDIWNNVSNVHCFSTENMKDWVHHGVAFSCFDVDWSSGYTLWPGDSGVSGNGKFYAYPSFRNRPFEIAVLEADSPEGPYRDALGKPLITNEVMAAHGIDVKKDLERYGNLNCIYVEGDKGEPWLIFGHFTPFKVKLKPNMVEFDGSITPLDMQYKADSAWEFIENPRIMKIGKRYLLIYMGYKNFEGKPNPFYASSDPEGPYIQYCWSDSLFGPYGVPKHLIYPICEEACNCTAYPVEFRGKHWLFYHVPYAGMEHRQTGFAELKIDTSGDPVPLHPGTDQPVYEQNQISLRLDAFGPLRFAAEYHQSLGAQSERGLFQFSHMKLNGGGWLRFDAVDFGEGARTVQAQVSCESVRTVNGWLEFRLDAPDGPLLAKVEIKRTVDHATYRWTSGDCALVSGVHNLYLVARGSHAPVSTSSPLFSQIDLQVLPQSLGPLFNVHAFRFER